MAKKPAAPVAAPSKPQNTVSRTRRNTLERKCLSKSAKRMFRGSSPSLFRAVVMAEQIERRRT